jgi:ATP-dependent Clp protease protease subunit
MIHQPWGGARGTAADIEIQAEEILKLRKTLNGVLSRHTGRPETEIEKDTDRDRFMDAQSAKTYGLVDDVVVTLKQAAKA